jgi:hypothetical protein
LRSFPKELIPYFLNAINPPPPEMIAKFDAYRHQRAIVSNLAVRQYGGRNEAEKVPPKVTFGSLRCASEAFVYVGFKRGRIKIGMSGSPARRCKSLGCSMQYAIQVVPSAAKTVETFALQALGATIEDDEWVDCSVEQAVSAVDGAWDKSAKLRHTDPRMTADEARLDRVSRARINYA